VICEASSTEEVKEGQSFGQALGLWMLSAMLTALRALLYEGPLAVVADHHGDFVLIALANTFSAALLVEDVVAMDEDRGGEHEDADADGEELHGADDCPHENCGVGLSGVGVDAEQS
jgi:hypothetical protein